MTKRLTTEEFIEKAKLVHGDKYDYSLVEYVRSIDKVKIICPKHGTFEQKANYHLSGNGCPKCANNSTSSLDEFIKKANKVHDNKYDYSLVEYVRAVDKVEITCSRHGSFKVTPNNHLSKKTGCPKCTNERLNADLNMGRNEFVKKSERIYGTGKYDYSLVEYVNSRKKVKIICPKHGTFEQMPLNHYRGEGCFKCIDNTIYVSNAENAIFKFVSKFYPDAYQSDRTILKPKELDIVIPSKKIAIEYCGLYWHSDKFKSPKYHYEKYKKCNELGYKLITIFEDEFIHDTKKVLYALKSLMGVSSRGLAARKLTLREVPSKDATIFLNRYHLQGSCPKSVSYGMYEDDRLVSVMSFGLPSRKGSKYKWELRRFSSDNKNRVGVASKLFKYFIDEHSPETVVSLSDCRWFDGNMYSILGFDYDGFVSPDYHYILGSNRYHKSRFTKKGFERHYPKIFDSKLTEKEMYELSPMSRIHDCGKKRWVWTNKKER